MPSTRDLGACSSKAGSETSIQIESQTKALIAARAALEKHAEQVVVMDLRALSSVTDFFVVCTAGSARQIAAIQEHIDAILARQGWPVWHIEGTALSSRTPDQLHQEDLQWILMDCGDIVVHLFDQSSRTFYRLEELWADAPRIPVTASPVSR